MKRCIAVGLLVIAACARPPGTPARPAPAPASADAIAIQVPDSIAGFAFARRHDYEDPALGVALRYVGAGGVEADVYLYPGPDFATDCPAACAQAHLAAEVRDFEANIIPTMVERGYVQSASVAATQSLARPEGAVWQLGHRVTLAVTRDGGAQRSEFYLYYLPGYRVKLRATFADTPQHRAAIDAFARAAVPALAGRRAPPT